MLYVYILRTSNANTCSYPVIYKSLSIHLPIFSINYKKIHTNYAFSKFTSKLLLGISKVCYELPSMYMSVLFWVTFVIHKDAIHCGEPGPIPI